MIMRLSVHVRGRWRVAALGLISVACLALGAGLAQGTNGSGGVTLVKRPVVPNGGSFLSLWHGSNRSLFEQFSLRDGAPLRALLAIHLGGGHGYDVSGGVLGPKDTIWFTRTSGPRHTSRYRTKEPGALVPDSCTGEVLRVDLSTGKTTVVTRFSSSMLVSDAQPSPDGRWLLMLAGGCTDSYFNMHLLAVSLRNGSSWTIGSEATVCHELLTPRWSANGSEIVFPYGPSNVLPGTTGPGILGGRYGEESCASSQPNSLAVVPRGTLIADLSERADRALAGV